MLVRISVGDNGFNGNGNTRLEEEEEEEERTYLPVSSSNTYMQRWMSDDGSRVFFDSSDALVARRDAERQAGCV